MNTKRPSRLTWNPNAACMTRDQGREAQPFQSHQGKLHSFVATPQHFRSELASNRRQTAAAVHHRQRLSIPPLSYTATVFGQTAQDQLKHGSGASNPARFQPSQHPRVLFVLPDSILVSFLPLHS
ncbi:hypothetical protein E3N88_29515 [Mikania micrantha]|uniref:Uncharacterized protein n=1 Tax=Mikania micrantha TaxID=192012 RepID=A0A5N6MJR3_9ASTR|nr:hypothetical protein E3N88_29515 [Mikania micrantha]